MSGPTLDRATRARVLLPFGLVTLIWGSTWLVIRGQLGLVPPSWSVSYRFLLAGGAMLAWAALRRQPLGLGRGHGIAALLGLCLFCLNFNFVYRAEQHVTSGLVALVFAILVVPNAILGRLVLGAELSRPFLAGSAVALVGIGVLFRHEMLVAGADAHAVALGLGLTVCGVLAASAGNVLQAVPAARRLPVVALTGWAMLWGAAANALWAAATAGPPAIEMTPAYLLGLVYLALAASALAFPLYFNVIRAIGPGRAAYSSVLVPVIAMALSTVFEDYRWSLEAVAGAALVLAGLVIALMARNPARQSG